MSETTFTIQRPLGPKEVTGFVVGPFGADRRKDEPNLDHTPVWGWSWSITHIASGLRLCVVRRKKDAARIMREMAKLGDWSDIRFTGIVPPHFAGTPPEGAKARLMELLAEIEARDLARFAASRDPEDALDEAIETRGEGCG